MIDPKLQNLFGNINKIIETLADIRRGIIDSYNKNLNNFKDTNFAFCWINSILVYIDDVHQNKYNLIKKRIKDDMTSLDKSKAQNYQQCVGTSQDERKFNIPSDNEKLDIFTSKDIQNRNNDIIRDFMQFSTNFIRDDDVKENQTLGTKLLQVANISRCAYNDSNIVLFSIYKEFEKEKDKDTIISSPDQFRKNFSNWVKKSKNWQYAKQYFDNNANKFHSINFLDEKKHIRNYFVKLYKDLLVLYFLCDLSFPSVDINFSFEDDYFNSKKMIDNFQIGKRHKPKVNFVYLPSLFSNGNYLENGKQWVFNYINNEKKKTFFFESNQLNLIPLIDESKKFKIPKIKDRLKIELIKNISYTPKTNYPISDNINKEYVIHIIDKNTKKAYGFKSKSSFNLKDNEEISKLELFLFNELVQEINCKNN